MDFLNLATELVGKHLTLSHIDGFGVYLCIDKISRMFSEKMTGPRMA